MAQIVSALLAIVIGIGTILLYFYGSNYLLDHLIPDKPGPDGVLISREKVRERIRPWLLTGPALLLLFVYLIYPTILTTYLSFTDARGRNFIGFANWERAFRDALFIESIRNNVMWLVIVPGVSVVLGLLIAALADSVRWGNIAKALIFMPMAISFVGASVIWKFIYNLDPNIGLMNAVIVGLGGQPTAVLQLPFWNNFFLMVVLIWTETGFAMVLLSAALRSVPEEHLEAARIDGASEVQIFFRVMLPQILGTIAVVWTTISITVLKVFDIVLAMTNGNWNTQVIANYMYDQRFRAFNTGYASMLALVIMLAVVPIMVVNIRRFQQEEENR